MFAGGAQPHHQRAGDQYRRVDAEADADGQRDGEVVERFAAEKQHGDDHQLRAAVRDDGAGNGTGDAVTITGQVTSVVVTSNSLVMAQTVTSAPVVKYKVSASGAAAAINVAGYQYTL